MAWKKKSVFLKWETQEESRADMVQIPPRIPYQRVQQHGMQMIFPVPFQQKQQHGIHMTLPNAYQIQQHSSNGSGGEGYNEEVTLYTGSSSNCSIYLPEKNTADDLIASNWHDSTKTQRKFKRKKNITVGIERNSKLKKQLPFEDGEESLARNSKKTAACSTSSLLLRRRSRRLNSVEKLEGGNYKNLGNSRDLSKENGPVTLSLSEDKEDFTQSEVTDYVRKLLNDCTNVRGITRGTKGLIVGYFSCLEPDPTRRGLPPGPFIGCEDKFVKLLQSVPVTLRTQLMKQLERAKKKRETSM